MRRAVAAALVAVLTVTAFAPAGFADAYDAAMARAIAAREKATDTNDPAAWEDAFRLFAEADALKSTKDSKYELASAAARLKEDDLAVEAYEAAIALGITGKAKEKAQIFIKAHESQVGRVDIKGPAGAEIVIGARHRGTLPRPPLVVFAGAVKIRATHGGQTVERSIKVKEGGLESVDLNPAFAPKPPSTASAVPAPSATAAPPEHKGASPTVPLSDTGAGARALGWSLLVGGGIVVVVGAGGLIASSKGVSDGRDQLDQHCVKRKPGDDDQCIEAANATEAQQINNTIKTWKNIRVASLVTGGVGIMIMSVGVVRLLTAPTPPRASAWKPRLDVGFGYVGVSGVF